MTVFWTGKGDGGETGAMGNGRIWKDSAQANALGDIDELNSVIGVTIANMTDEHISNLLMSIQNNLFVIGAEISAADETVKLPGKIKPTDIKGLEGEIDDIGAKVPELKKFVLPGGSISGSYLHLSRSIARRAERSIVTLSKTKEINKNIPAYLNRLSSFLFAAALYMNKKEGIEESNPSY